MREDGPIRPGRGSEERLGSVPLREEHAALLRAVGGLDDVDLIVEELEEHPVLEARARRAGGGADAEPEHIALTP